MGEAQAVRTGLTGLFHAAADAVLSVCLAPLCASCGTVLDQPTSGAICGACWARVGPAVALWAHAGAHLTAVGAAGLYDGVLRDAVHALKYDARRSLAAPLASLMTTRCVEVLSGVDGVVPVPLHPWRRAARGFNQAHDLARRLGLPVHLGLRRSRWTTTQTDLSADARHANVRGAFEATDRAGALRGRVVALVDDVCTTGATLEACARALVEAGAGEVRAVTAARVPGPPR